MPNEYNGAAFATILPTTFIDNFLQQKKQDRNFALQELRVKQTLKQQQDRHASELTKYFQTLRGDAAKSVKPGSADADIMNAGIYSITNGIQDILKNPESTTGDVLDYWNQNYDKYNRIHSNFNAAESQIAQQAKAAEAYGVDPADFITHAREKMYFDDKGKFSEDKLINYDPANTVGTNLLTNESDLLQPSKKLDLDKLLKTENVAIPAEDVKVNGRLISRPAMTIRTNPLLYAVSKNPDGSITHKKTGGEPIIGDDGLPLKQDFSQQNNDGTFAPTNTPVIGYSPEQFDAITTAKPQALFVVNRDLAAANRKLRDAGKESMDDQQAEDFRRARLWQLIKEPPQPLQGMVDLQGRSDMSEARSKRLQASAAALQASLLRLRKTVGDDDWMKKLDTHAAATAALADVKEAKKKIKELEAYGTLTDDQQKMLDEAKVLVAKPIPTMIDQKLQGTTPEIAPKKEKPLKAFQKIVNYGKSAIDSLTGKKPTVSKWDKYKE